MNRIYSNKSIVFLRYIFIFVLLLIVTAKTIPVYAGQVSDATTDDAKNASEEQPPAAATLNLKSVAIVKGKIYTLKVYNLTKDQTVVFKSDNEEIALVDEIGAILGVDYGTTTITASIKEGNKVADKLTCEVTIGTAAISVKFINNEHTLVVGTKIVLKTILEPFNTVETARYISLNPLIATVSATGRVTTKSVGATAIFVIIDNKKFDICLINVIEEDIDEEDEEPTENTNNLLDDTDALKE